MRWFNKHSIKRVIQWFLLLFSTFMGFWWSYIFILFLIWSTANVWVTIGAICLAVSSTYGLFYWLVND